MKKRIYLDNNASTPLDEEIVSLIVESLTSLVGNPSSIHSYGRHLNQQLLDARDSIAMHLNVLPKEIIFTSGATESVNLLLNSLFSKNFKGHIITSDLEHPCVYKTILYLEQKGVAVTRLSGGLLGTVTSDQVESAIRPDTKLIALMAANNETGIKTDIDLIAKIAENRGILFFVDAVASFGKDLFKIMPGISALCLSAHKIHAPKGVGLLFVRKNLKLAPVYFGGEQEYGKRPGTENLSGIIAFAKAIEIIHKNLENNISYMSHLRDTFEEKILSSLSNVTINGQGARICNTSNLAFKDIEGEVLLAMLDTAGVAASHGSACASGALEPSRVLVNMGLGALAKSSIRFSFSRMNTLDEAKEAAEIVIKTAEKLQNKTRI